MAIEETKFQPNLAVLIITVIITTSRGQGEEIPTCHSLDPGQVDSDALPTQCYNTLSVRLHPPPHPLKSRGGEGWWQEERGIWELGAVGRRVEVGGRGTGQFTPAILPIRVGREQERRVRSPGWRQGANQRGCYSPPGDLFKGLRLWGREQILAVVV